MTRFKRVLSLVIAMIMCLGTISITSVAATETNGFDNFAVQNTVKADTFTDFTESDWFYADVKAAYELGLMLGKGENTFAPESFVTIAEALTIAARLNSIYTTGTDEFELGEVWYQTFTDYAIENGILTFEVENFDAPAKRSEFALIMANALPEQALEAVNAVADGAIPDIAADAAYAEAVYALYRAGIMIGGDETGTFAPETEIKRCEVAAITARLAIPELRREVTLGEEAVESEDTTVPEDSTAPEDTTVPKDTTVPEDDAAREKALKELLLALVGVQSGNGENEALIEITEASLTANGTAASSVNVGDVLTLNVTPADATGLINWTVGGTEILNHTNTYTVTSLDMGKTIRVEFLANGSFTGTASAQCTVASATTVNVQDIAVSEAGSAPVALTDIDNTKFLDENGDEIEVDENDTLTLTIEEADASDDQTDEAIEIVAQQIMSDNTDVSADDIADLEVTAVDVDLSVNDTAVHPVGDVTITLSAVQLGLDEDTDLSLYSFTASHTNKEDTPEVVPGTLVIIDGVQYIRFELNGLSRIWIGNIPPRTVSFYLNEEDADNMTNSIGSVIVKFGDLTPTLLIPTPSIDGHLFCGWNYDMTRTPITRNLWVHALWVKGEMLPMDNFIYEPSEEADDLYVEIDDGSILIDTDVALGLPANINAKVTVIAPETAVKYYVTDSSADVVSEHDESIYTAITSDSDISFSFKVTDEDGLLIASTCVYYYKWIDAEGEVIAVNEIKVRIANGSDTATSKVYNIKVDRGIGTFEAYLLDSDDSTKDYVAYVNNHLSGHFTRGYTLNNNASFDGYRVDQNFSAYNTLKFIFTPFEGESYSKEDVITAVGSYDIYNKDTDEWTYVEDWTGSYEISDGKLIVTYPFDVTVMNEDWAYVVISVNDTVQEIGVNWDHAEEIYDDDDEDDGNDDKYENRIIEITCETWAEVLEALKDISAKKEYHIDCTDKSAITLSTSLTIPANVNIYLHYVPSFTVANGAVLTLTDNSGYECAANLRIRGGDFIVENGGIVTSAAVGGTDRSRWVPSLRAANITFKSGAALILPEDTLLTVSRYSSYDESETGILTFEKGSVVNNSGSLRIRNFKTVNLNGTVNSTTDAYFECDEINISGTVNVSGDFELYGTVNIDQTGMLIAEGEAGGRHYYYARLEIYGPMANRGTIELKNCVDAEIMNNGFANYNMGTISIGTDCYVYTTGTKFINSGKIIGKGIIEAQLGDDYTNYDDGTEWVEIEDDVYWDEALDNPIYLLSDYTRYKYTHDPAPTARVLLYRSDVINVGDGECTVEVIEEDFPEIGE